jgi:tetratricopeptide (TPR) repeat protein
MRRLALMTGLVTLAAASVAPAAAQEGYAPPSCELSTSHFLVNSGVVYIMGASEEPDPVKKQRLLTDAHRNLIDAIGRGQEENPAVWYFLGRYYVMSNDVVGADSAFDRALEGEPECATDIEHYRKTLWVPVVNRALDSLRQGAFEGAKEVLREANTIWGQDNLGPYYMARIFADEGEPDSSLVYFKQVVDLGTADTARVQNYFESLRYIAILYAMEERWDSAAVWYERNRAEVPGDPEMLIGLANAYQNLERVAEAMALYDTVLARAEEMSAEDLFRTGEALFIADQFEMAAQAFVAGMEKNTFYRPGLYNLANAHFAMYEDTTKTEEEQRESAQAMEAAALRLVEVDPYNEESLRLLAASYQFQRKDDSTLAVLERIEALPFQVIVDLQQPVEGGFAVQGRVTNPKEEPATVTDIVFDFLDGEGNVLFTDTVAGFTLDPRDSVGFQLTGVGEEIVAVRYRTEGG